MKHTILLHLLIVALFAFAYSQTTTTTYTESDVFVQDLKLFVKGQEFFIKAMAYEPVPLGIMNVSDDGWGGTGFCSAKKTVFAEYKSACHGSDFIDASTDYRRVPKGPASSTGALLPWWQQVWQRDLPKIKELGANTIRIYNMNPITKKFLTMYPNAISGIKDSSVAADHKPFLDYAHSMGFKVILPIVQDRDLLLESSSELLDQMITAAVTDLGDHPALLMWCLGNEVDIPQNTQLMDIINDKMDVVRQKMKQIHNRVVPVTSAVIDIPKDYETLAANLKVDVFTTNAGYRDTVMDPLWDGETVDGYEFRGWTALSKAVNKPLFIGEIGMHQVNNQINIDRPDWFNQQWQQIVNHIDNGCVGACFFEYSDEPQKPLEQQTMGVVSLSVAKSGSKSSTDANAWIPDNVNEKNIYAALKTGLDGSAVKNYNMNANVFTLINRQPATVDVQAEPSTGKSTGQEESDPNQQPDDSSGGSNIKSGAFWIGAFVALAVMMFFNSFFKN